MQSLEQKTQSYWLVSSVWNGQVQNELNMGDAIDSCTSIIQSLWSPRPVKNLTQKLLDELIEGEGKPPLEDTKLLSFPDSADIVSAQS